MHYLRGMKEKCSRALGMGALHTNDTVVRVYSNIKINMSSFVGPYVVEKKVEDQNANERTSGSFGLVS